jgi:Transport and Golgi organisation 2
MCTVLLRLRPEAAWPLLVAAVRDEFLDRPWDPPAAHWPVHPSIVGGRDRTAGGTWLAVETTRPAFAAVLNGVRLPPSPLRPSRGALPLAALTDSLPSSFEGYDGFHLVAGTPSTVVVWSWDGVSLVRRELPPGDHIIVNDGVDAASDPLVPHFTPLLTALPAPPLVLGSSSDASDASSDAESDSVTEAAWGPWAELLRGDGLALSDPRALLLRKEFDGTEPGTEPFAGRVYGSSSVALVGLTATGVRYDFSATPLTPAWRRLSLSLPSR